MTRGPEPFPLIEIKIADRAIKATGKHPFITRQGIRPAYELKVGDEILLDDDRFVAISELNPIPKAAGEAGPVVWNIEIEAPDEDLDSHNLVANGITTGDLMIQTKLQSGLIK